MYPRHQFPCLHCQHDYIRMVQHMIERCLLFHMNRDDCVKALAKHAKIEPIITLTVWKELLKENKAFFHEYFQAISPRQYFSSKANKTLHADYQFGKIKIVPLKGWLLSEEESIGVDSKSKKSSKAL